MTLWFALVVALVAVAGAWMIRRLLLPREAAISGVDLRGSDLRRYLGLCAFMASQAEQALADVPPRHLLTMRYEDLVADPEAWA